MKHLIDKDALVMNKNYYIDDPIGTTFDYEGNELTVTESIDGGRTCRGCWFARKEYRKACYRHRHACTPANRKDKKQVVFRDCHGNHIDTDELIEGFRKLMEE